jgi:hypothetical protein
MSKFANATAAPPKGAIATVSPVPDTVTHEGAPAFSRDAKSELFTLAVTNMVGEDTFYEAKSERDQRFQRLIAQVTSDDPGWIARFVPFLRNEMGMRSAAVVMACEYVKAGGPFGRRVIDAACVRADEPAEVLGYWRSKYGRAIPKPVRRGMADAYARLYTERAALKYDGGSRGVRMADVLEVAHSNGAAPAWQADLFKWLLDQRHDARRPEGNGARSNPIPESLAMLRANAALEAIPTGERRALLDDPALTARLKAAGATWEWLSGWLQGPMDAKAWEAIIPEMGAMALTRNLRNFDEAKISPAAVEAVTRKLTDPAEIKASRQLPFRFLSAHRNTPSGRWTPALEAALDASTANVPVLPGKTLVLVDVSGSMAQELSHAKVGGMALQKPGTAQGRRPFRFEVGALFAAALHKAAGGKGVDLVLFGTYNAPLPLHATTGVLRAIDEVTAVQASRKLDYGTMGYTAMRQHFAGHDRVVVFTDEQMSDAEPPAGIRRLYTFNLAGYEAAMGPGGSDGRYTLGGFSDATFKQLAMLDKGVDQGWPF